MKKTANLLLVLGLGSSLISCATNSKLLSAQQQFRNGNFKDAANRLANPASREKIDSRDAVILKLEAGSMALLAGKQDQAHELLKSADKAIESANQRPLVQVGRETGAMVTNLNSLPYVPPPSNQIMAASYLALSFASKGMLTEARSVVKLAKNRQSDAFAKYQKEIDNERNTMEQARANSETQFTLNSDKISNISSTIEADLSQYAPYTNFSVPYSELIAGILLGAGEGAEPSRAAESFSRTLAAAPSNSAVRSAAAGAIIGRVHLLLEDGVAPSLDQTVFNLPLYINNKLTMFSAAYPKLVIHPHQSSITIKAGGTTAKPELVCDFDRIAADEFRRRLPGIISRTTVASATKAMISFVAQESMRKQNPDAALIMGIVGAAYNITSAQADLRTWATLPKLVSYSNLAMPADRIVEINGQSIKIPESKTAIIRVRQVAGKQAMEIITL